MYYIGYDTDGHDVFIDEQTLHEVYLQPFRAAVEAGVSSLMCSYNEINGVPACGSREMLTTVLRDQLGFKGFVTSDWGATHGTNFINAGLDVEMSGPLPVPWKIPSYFVNQPKYYEAETDKPRQTALSDLGLPEEPVGQPYVSSSEPLPSTNLMTAIASGEVTEEAINRAAGRVLLQMEKFGYLDGGNKLEITPTDTAGDAQILEKVAIQGAVLLKNEAHILTKVGATLGPCGYRAEWRTSCGGGSDG